MGTKIEWTHRTWNPLAGCSKVSPGCKNCYAMIMAHRLTAMGIKKYAGTTHKTTNGVEWTGIVNLDEDALSIPLKAKKPTMFFVNSMSDLFHEDVPDEFIERVFGIMLKANRHTFQVLTKRAKRMRDFMIEHQHLQSSNIWLGVSVENQEQAALRIPFLLDTPSKVRWLSCEPMLGGFNLLWCLKIYSHVGEPCCRDKKGYHKLLDGNSLLNWVVIGGESGRRARPFEIEGARDLVLQCKTAGVPVFVKQLGARPYCAGMPVFTGDNKGGDWNMWDHELDDLKVREFPNL